jgi:hypothetical protein
VLHCRRTAVALTFHTVCLIWYTTVWVWHTTPAAAFLPGSKGFGWFFRYLTFYSFTLQLIALGLSVADGIAKLVSVRPVLQQPMRQTHEDASMRI